MPFQLSFFSLAFILAHPHQCLHTPVLVLFSSCSTTSSTSPSSYTHIYMTDLSDKHIADLKFFSCLLHHNNCSNSPPTDVSLLLLLWPWSQTMTHVITKTVVRPCLQTEVTTSELSGLWLWSMGKILCGTTGDFICCNTLIYTFSIRLTKPEDNPIQIPSELSLVWLLHSFCGIIQVTGNQST